MRMVGVIDHRFRICDIKFRTSDSSVLSVTVTYIFTGATYTYVFIHNTYKENAVPYGSHKIIEWMTHFRRRRRRTFFFGGLVEIPTEMRRRLTLRLVRVLDRLSVCLHKGSTGWAADSPLRILLILPVKNRFVALSGINLGRPINSALSHLMTPDLDV